MSWGGTKGGLKFHLFNSRVGSETNMTLNSQFFNLKQEAGFQIKTNELSAHPKAISGNAQGQISKWLQMNTTKNKVHRCHFGHEVGSRHGQLAKGGHWKVRFSASAATLPSTPSLKGSDLKLDVNATVRVGSPIKHPYEIRPFLRLDNPCAVQGELEGGLIAARVQPQGFGRGLRSQSPA